MKRVLYCTLLFLSSIGIASSRPTMATKEEACNGHVTKAIAQYIENNSNAITESEKNCLAEFINAQGRNIPHRYEFISRFDVRHAITITKVQTNRVSKKKK